MCVILFRFQLFKKGNGSYLCIHVKEITKNVIIGFPQRTIYQPQVDSTNPALNEQSSFQLQLFVIYELSSSCQTVDDIFKPYMVFLVILLFFVELGWFRISSSRSVACQYLFCFLYQLLIAFADS